MSTAFKKILVIQTAFIGDAILASAALESIHKKFPQTELHILVRNGNETLFENHPYLKKVWVWNKKENKIKKKNEAQNRMGNKGVVDADSGAEVSK